MRFISVLFPALAAPTTYTSTPPIFSANSRALAIMLVTPNPVLQLINRTAPPTLAKLCIPRYSSSRRTQFSPLSWVNSEGNKSALLAAIITGLVPAISSNWLNTLPEKSKRSINAITTAPSGLFRMGWSIFKNASWESCGSWVQPGRSSSATVPLNWRLWHRWQITSRLGRVEGSISNWVLRVDRSTSPLGANGRFSSDRSSSFSASLLVSCATSQSTSCSGDHSNPSTVF
mmetsp:Transcript_21369/g.26176  ORF Transcript_21369/g.26176 Transcript_21369/m.26176 type:complete len:231 (-) Transcript_21369:123-815(-)